MKYINELREGDNISEIYLCRKKQSLITKNGKSYESLTLQDKTGSLDAKIWDPGNPGVDEFDALDYVEVSGNVTAYQGHLQLNIRRARVAREGEYLAADFLPVSGRSVDDMFGELQKFIGTVQEPHLKKLLDSFFTEDAAFIKVFRRSSAAKSVHHGFVGGLLEHTLGVTTLCHYFARTYPILNRDLLITSAILHDIGKTRELSAFPQNDYTDDGQLLGHIVIGVEMVDEKLRDIPDFPRALSSELRHCILAHHGELEFGSPKKPAIVEAIALNFADNMDAKMEIFKEAVAASTGDDWIGWQGMLDSNIRKTTLS